MLSLLHYTKFINIRGRAGVFIYSGPKSDLANVIGIDVAATAT